MKASGYLHKTQGTGIANSLVDQHIGLEETDDSVWSNYFNTVLIATLNERDYIIRG